MSTTVTNVGTFPKRAKYQMIAASPDVRKDSGEEAATKLVIVWMMHLAGSRMDTVRADARKDSGEEAAIKLVIVWMMHLAGSQMDTVKPDARLDSGEEAAIMLVIVWMINLAGSQMDTVKPNVRLGSGEEVVMNNVTVEMERLVIRPMEHVRPVSLNMKFYFLFYLKTIGQFCFQCIVTKNAYLSDVPIIEDGNFLFIHFLIFPELSSTIKHH